MDTDFEIDGILGQSGNVRILFSLSNHSHFQASTSGCPAHIGVYPRAIDLGRLHSSRREGTSVDPAS